MRTGKKNRPVFPGGRRQPLDTFSYYPWQLRAYRAIRGKNAVLSAPTGSGKTLVAYLWAGILDEEGFPAYPEGGRIIFTAPIKALSNERYLDLRKMGFDVGIETGDFKKNEGASIICCTQEIYSLKYAFVPGQKLIVDEFHYIFDDPDRARAYIDGIRDTDPATSILVMSATLGGASSVADYLGGVTGRKFTLYENTRRETELIYIPAKPAKIDRLKDALVFLFSQKGAVELAFLTSKHRKRISAGQRDRLQEIASILEVPKIQPPLFNGVGIYHGGMLPKEKLLVERAFRERILDVVCGTNALALGVNLPAETVVFAQLVHYHSDRPISRNEFSQMSGRAGRKGLFDPGYVTWLLNSPFERRGFSTGDIFRELVDASPEPASVILRPSFGRLLRKQVLPEAEAEYIAEFSWPKGDPCLMEHILRSGMNRIDRAVRKLVGGHEKKKFRKLLAALWYDEMDIEENLEMAYLFFTEEMPGAIMAAQVVLPFERNYLQALLKVKRYANRLPKGYAFRSMKELNAVVDDIDPTVYGFEEKIGEIEDSMR
ncbi:MAG: DEAD/DEAH box helicase [Aminivibrio sp.]|nr:DEAD/DEAH box helicase [Aminivibrio sp.]